MTIDYPTIVVVSTADDATSIALRGRNSNWLSGVVGFAVKAQRHGVAQEF
jgi:hypothetical protein